MLQRGGRLTDVGLPLQAVAVTAAVERNMSGDACQKSIEIVGRLMGRDAVPCLQIGVVFAFLSGLSILHDAEGQSLQAGTVLVGCVADSGFAAGKIQSYDLRILQNNRLLSTDVKAFIPISTLCIWEVTL